MKKLILFSFIISSQTLMAQNVGIGTTSPQARLHITDSNVVFTGPVTVPATTAYSPSIEDAGSRMLWYPQKAAFRVGNVNSTQWNKDSIGRYSFASGYNTKSFGEGAFASGYITTAKGIYSTAMGFGTTASGNTSTAIGNYTFATGDYSTAMGFTTIASGDYSYVTGIYSSATGYNSTALGSNSKASGDYSTATGYFSAASGNFSTSMGYYTKARSFGSLVIGLANDTSDIASPSFIDPANRIFQIGNGTANNARRNAITVLQNGNTGIGTTTPNQLLHVYGSATATSAKIENGGTAEAMLELKGGGAGSRNWMVRSEGSGSAVGAGKLNFRDNTAALSRMIIDLAGNVGIGTTTPGQLLEVVGPENTSIDLKPRPVTVRRTRAR